MPRDTISITISDLSTFTKTQRNSLIKQYTLPGHASMLTLVSKAAGYDSFQHLKAAKPSIQPEPQDKKLQKALKVFENGIMTRWPNQTAIQGLCLWVFWAALPARTDLSEKDINTLVKSGHSFGDHALLRRSLLDHKLVTRTADGKIYRRIEQAPPPEARILLATI